MTSDEDELDEEEEDELYPDGWSQPAYHNGRVRLMKEKCSTCIFRPGNKMDLYPGRVAGMLKEIRAADTFIPCHKTLGSGQPGAICRGGNDAHVSFLMRFGLEHGLVLEVTEEEVLAEGERYRKMQRDHADDNG